MTKSYVSFLVGVLVVNLSCCFGMNHSYSDNHLSTAGIDVSIDTRPSSTPSTYNFSEKDLELFERVVKTMISCEQQINPKFRDSIDYINAVSRDRDIIDFSIYCYGRRKRGEDICPPFEKIRELVRENRMYDDSHLLKVLDLATYNRIMETIENFKQRTARNVH